MHFGNPIPILRIFDEAKAREFYVGFLSFKIDWEARFEPGTPIYLQISRGDAKLHLSEHHGDASPGANVRIPCDDLDALHAELMGKMYKYNRPGIEHMPWGREIRTNDPFFNRVVFFASDRKTS